MSSDRSTNRPPLKPSLSSTRTARTPITPRIAGNLAPSTSGPRLTPTVRSEPSTPRSKQAAPSGKDALGNSNVTPRSPARISRNGDVTASPRQADSAARPKLASNPSEVSSERNGSVSSVGKGSESQSKARSNRPRSIIIDSSAKPAPWLRPSGFYDLSPKATEESAEGGFFHASDAPRVEPKKAQFFHADGKQEESSLSPMTLSPVLSAISEQRSVPPLIRSGTGSQSAKSPPVQATTLSPFSNVSPFFTAASIQPARQPSPTSSKENIHLSYRKGASQIFGTRPSSAARSITSNSETGSAVGNPSAPINARHYKSPSLSSIDSYNSFQSRRRSTTGGDIEPIPSPLAQEVKPAAALSLLSSLPELSSNNTSLESPGPLSRAESGLSPTRSGAELAADARRERKVLDLEISNSSLMAINNSLEREVRRQKAELKRFRRLSRAGRLSFGTSERSRTLSNDLSTLTEESETDEYFGLKSAGSEEEDTSDDDEGSISSSTEPLGPSAQDRLAKDERRLQLDLQRHKELLMQSQSMNQSLKRCMYATEDMIREGKKAIEYHVRVSDVKLGGRVLSTEEDADESREIEVLDDMVLSDNQKEKGRDFLDTWTHVTKASLDGSENGDRDSGIEVENPPLVSPELHSKAAIEGGELRPSGLRDLGRFGSFG